MIICYNHKIILLAIIYTAHLQGMLHLSPRTKNDKHVPTIGHYLEESLIFTYSVAHLAKDGKSPAYLTTPYCILHLETLTRLVQKYPHIRSLTPEKFIEQHFALAYEFVYNQPAPSSSTEQLKYSTLKDLYSCLNLIISKRTTELEACRQYAKQKTYFR